MARKFGESDYRQGALERLRESNILIEQEQFAGAAYLAGRAVEGMLRAVIWLRDEEIRRGVKSLDTGHDLREMLAKVQNLGVLREYPQADELTIDVQHVARLWFNNMRFISTGRMKTHWWEFGELVGKRTLKQATGDFYNACSAIVKRCEALCQR